MMTISVVMFSSSWAQDTTLLDHFQGMVVEERVQLVWIVKQGNTCDGMVIERRTEGEPFEEIGRIEGICGNVSQPQRYDFFDSNPVWNRKSYYRLSTRGDVVSVTIEIEAVDVSPGGILIAPHPATMDSRLYFENPKAELHKVILVGLDGKSRAEIETREERVDFGELDLIPGSYLVLIRSEAGVVTARGKVVLR